MQNFAPNTKGLKVLTPEGYCNFAGVACMGDREIFRIILENGNILECSEKHKVYDIEFNQIEVKDLQIGTLIDVNDTQGSKVINVTNTGRVEPVFDLIEVDNISHIYYTDGILSSNCEFIIADQTLINGMTLQALTSSNALFNIDDIRWFSEPEANRVYAVALDPAMGTGGGDFSAIQVFDLSTMTQVAEWRDTRTRIDGQVQILLKILYYIYQTIDLDSRQEGEPEIYWSVENNTLGEAALQVIEQVGEENFPGYFVHEPKKSGGGHRKGLYTSNKSKLSACSRIKKPLESNKMRIKSKPLISELKTFVRGAGSYQAKSGAHDDLVMSTMLIIRIFQVVSGWETNINTSLNEDFSIDDMTIEPMPIIM